MSYDIRDIRLRLADPEQVASKLDLKRSKEERYKWSCPRHGGSSLSLKRGRDGTLQVKCFGCDLSGDVFALIAEVFGTRTFAQALKAAAELVGVSESAIRLNLWSRAIRHATKYMHCSTRVA
jgi:DNA primase